MQNTNIFDTDLSLQPDKSAFLMIAFAIEIWKRLYTLTICGIRDEAKLRLAYGFLRGYAGGIGSLSA
jgi:hypothetical protein